VYKGIIDVLDIQGIELGLGDYKIEDFIET